MNWLADRWNELARLFSHNVHIGARAGIAIGDILLIFAAGLVLFMVVRLISNYVREIPSTSSAHAIPHRIAAEALYERSLQAAASGEYAAAIALLFRAALTALDVRGFLHEEPSLTVNECRREVGTRAPEFTKPFDSLARIFTAAVYAQTPIGAIQWNAALQAYAQLSGKVSDAA